jgi:hypothetical protein
MENKLGLPNDPSIAKKVIDSQHKQRQLEIQSGYLGKFFGTSASIHIYIVGVVSIGLIISLLVYTFIPDGWKSLPTVELWKIVLPVLTTLLGFLFGASTKQNT